MVGVLSESEIDELLMTALFARLGCHADGKTYVVPVSFAYDGHRIVGHTTEGLKTAILRRNPSVCLQFDEVKSLTDWKSVILWGEIEELQGVDAAVAAGLLIDRYGPIFEENPSDNRRGREVTPPRLDLKPAKHMIYAIKIGERSGRFERP
ncbi:MAG TPA: pyridoxamine 5'-phosphate oxidase family protein [Fimbriimonas sp.]|nr:pyridoxamine 5'-phosphate oxidase family protein [Fimbriimonas sp.]